MGASWFIPNKLIHVEVQIVKTKVSFLSEILTIGEEKTLTLAADSWQLSFLLGSVWHCVILARDCFGNRVVNLPVSRGNASS